MISTQKVAGGPAPISFPPPSDGVKQWDALQRYQRASAAPNMSLAKRLELARDTGFRLPEGIARPWEANPWATPAANQEEGLAQFNAVVDALLLLSAQGSVADLRPGDFRVLDVFAFFVPRAGYFVKLTNALGGVATVPVYRR